MLFSAVSVRYWLSVFMLLPGILHAVELPVSAAARKPLAAADSPVGAEQLASVTLGLLLVLALIFALAWLYRRYGNFTPFNRSNIQILGGVSLGSREKAVLLEVEGTRLLVGVAAGQVNTLHVFDRQAPATNTAFADNLQQQIKQSGKSTAEPEKAHGENVS